VAVNWKAAIFPEKIRQNLLTEKTDNRFMTVYYLDTCIWRDFYEDRFSKAGNPLGRYATLLFMKILKNGDKILFSNSIILELKKDYAESEINLMLNFLFQTDVLIKIDTLKEEYIEAKKLSKDKNISLIDCLHAVQARNNDAVMVSQDVHFFEKLGDTVETKRPQFID
jgi:predicted nucleic acid-binding protein